jgi:hypothetical protein
LLTSYWVIPAAAATRSAREDLPVAGVPVMSTFGRVRRVLGFFEPPIVACAVEFGANERRRRLLVATRRKFA